MKTTKTELTTQIVRGVALMRLLAFLFLLIVIIKSASAQSPDSVRATYRRAIGVSEATGRNDGPEVESYLASVGLRRGAPWCAAFVSYCLQKGGYTQAPRSGWSPAYFAPLERYLYKGDALALGDSTRVYIFGVYYPHLGRIAHVGFIEPLTRLVPRGYILTVEGNSNDNGSREGVAVVRKLRPLRTVKAVRGW